MMSGTGELKSPRFLLTGTHPTADGAAQDRSPYARFCCAWGGSAVFTARRAAPSAVGFITIFKPDFTHLPVDFLHIGCILYF